MPENPNFSLVASILGTEITASLWALFAFSGSDNNRYNAGNDCFVFDTHPQGRFPKSPLKSNDDGVTILPKGDYSHGKNYDFKFES